MILAEGNRSSRRKIRPRAIFFPTTDSTWTSPRMNPGHRGGRTATNRLSQGTALKLNLMSVLLRNAIPTSQKTLRFHCKDQSVKADYDNSVTVL